jgi:hypothetical protein
MLRVALTGVAQAPSPFAQVGIAAELLTIMTRTLAVAYENTGALAGCRKTQPGAEQYGAAVHMHARMCGHRLAHTTLR